MAQIREIRQRIRSVHSIEQITKAMKMVAAVKMKRFQDAILRARPYAYRMRTMLQEVTDVVNPEGHPLLARRDAGKILLVVVTADKGLCGSFNSNIIRRANAFLRAQPPDGVELILVGRRGIGPLKRSGFPVVREFAGIFRDVGYEQAEELGEEICRGFVSRGITRVVCIYNEFKSAMAQRVLEEQLLPLAHPGAGTPTEYLYEPREQELLEQMLPRCVHVQVYRILLESQAAEMAAKLAAMSAATDNAGEMIRSLTMVMNRIRQAGITREILEVVSGADALK